MVTDHSKAALSFLLMKALHEAFTHGALQKTPEMRV
jgi:hypothetical protein